MLPPKTSPPKRGEETEVKGEIYSANERPFPFVRPKEPKETELMSEKREREREFIMRAFEGDEGNSYRNSQRGI